MMPGGTSSTHDDGGTTKVNYARETATPDPGTGPDLTAEITRLRGDATAILNAIQDIAASAAERYGQLEETVQSLKTRLDALDERNDLFSLVAHAVATAAAGEWPGGLLILPPINQAVLDACDAPTGTTAEVAIRLGGYEVTRTIRGGSDAVQEWQSIYRTYLELTGTDTDEETHEVVPFAGRASGRATRP